MVRAGERGIQPHSVCNYYNSLASPAGRPANAAEQRCAGTFVHGMQLKSSAERLTASHDMHPCILCLLVIGGKSPSLRSLAVQGFGSFDPLCLCCVLPRSASMYRATQAPGRQAGEEERKAPRDPSCEHEPRFPHHREGGLCSCLPPALGTAPYVGRLLGAPYHYSVHDGRSVFPGGRRASGCRGGRCDAGVFCLLGLVISVRSQQRGQPCQCRHR